MKINDISYFRIPSALSVVAPAFFLSCSTDTTTEIRGDSRRNFQGRSEGRSEG
jgi:hypothetical protein